MNRAVTLGALLALVLGIVGLAAVMRCAPGVPAFTIAGLLVAGCAERP